MSALGQKRTSRCSFDNLVGTLLQKQWHVQPKLFRRLKIDDQFKFRRQLHWQLRWLRAFENAVDVASSAPDQVGDINAIGYQATVHDYVTEVINCGYPILGCQCSN